MSVVVRRRLCRRKAQTISRARGAANIHARGGLTTFYSQLIGARARLVVEIEFRSLCGSMQIPFVETFQTWGLIRRQYKSGMYRDYHNLDHIADCLALLKVVPFYLSDNDLALIQFALIMHDACYDTWARDNEERSAVFGHFCLDRMGLDSSHFLRQFESLVMPATKHPLMVSDRLGRIMADIDLYGLSISEKEFRENTNKIRHEFFWAYDEEFIKSHIDFFERMLARPSIYQTEWFKANLEKSARYNLKRAMAELRAA